MPSIYCNICANFTIKAEYTSLPSLSSWLLQLSSDTDVDIATNLAYIRDNRSIKPFNRHGCSNICILFHSNDLKFNCTITFILNYKNERVQAKLLNEIT